MKKYIIEEGRLASLVETAALNLLKEAMGAGAPNVESIFETGAGDDLADFMAEYLYEAIPEDALFQLVGKYFDGKPSYEEMAEEFIDSLVRCRIPAYVRMDVGHTEGERGDQYLQPDDPSYDTVENAECEIYDSQDLEQLLGGNRELVERVRNLMKEFFTGMVRESGELPEWVYEF